MRLSHAATALVLAYLTLIGEVLAYSGYPLPVWLRWTCVGAFVVGSGFGFVGFIQRRRRRLNRV